MTTPHRRPPRIHPAAASPFPPTLPIKRAVSAIKSTVGRRRKHHRSKTAATATTATATTTHPPLPSTPVATPPNTVDTKSVSASDRSLCTTACRAAAITITSAAALVILAVFSALTIQYYRRRRRRPLRGAMPASYTAHASHGDDARGGGDIKGWWARLTGRGRFLAARTRKISAGMSMRPGRSGLETPMGLDSGLIFNVGKEDVFGIEQQHQVLGNVASVAPVIDRRVPTPSTVVAVPMAAPTGGLQSPTMAGICNSTSPVLLPQQRLHRPSCTLPPSAVASYYGQCADIHLDMIVRPRETSSAFELPLTTRHRVYDSAIDPPRPPRPAAHHHPPSDSPPSSISHLLHQPYSLPIPPNFDDDMDSVYNITYGGGTLPATTLLPPPPRRRSFSTKSGSCSSGANSPHMTDPIVSSPRVSIALPSPLGSGMVAMLPTLVETPSEPDGEEEQQQRQGQGQTTATSTATAVEVTIDSVAHDKRRLIKSVDIPSPLPGSPRSKFVSMMLAPRLDDSGSDATDGKMTHPLSPTFVHHDRLSIQQRRQLEAELAVMI